MSPSVSPIDLTSNGFSKGLLDHDGLMTPVLLAQFGPLTARQTEGKQIENRFLRQSTIYQAATGEKILDAELDISLQSLPATFLDCLQQQDILFGQLLRDFSIDVRIMDRTLYQSDQSLRWGRRLSICNANTLDLICKVQELMVGDAQLLPIRLKQ